jgi:hypothetical protein
MMTRSKRTRRSTYQTLLAFFGDNMLADINTALCKRYLAERGKQAAPRRELEDLRAAIGHHRKEGLCATPVPVWIPARGQPLPLLR